MDKEKTPEKWVEQIGEIEAANKNPSKQKELLLGRMKSESTTVKSEGSIPEEVLEEHLEKGKEQAHKPSQPEVQKDFDHEKYQKIQDARIEARDLKTSHYPEAPKGQQVSKAGGLLQKAKSFLGNIAKFGGKTAFPLVGAVYSTMEVESVGDGTLDGPLAKEKEPPNPEIQEPQNQEQNSEQPQLYPNELHSENKANDPSPNQPETPAIASANESRAEPQQLANEEKSRVLDLLRDDKPFSFSDSEVGVPDLSDMQRKELMLALNSYAPDKTQFNEYYNDRNEPEIGKEEPASNTEERNEPSLYPDDKEVTDLSIDGNDSRTDFQELTNDEKTQVLDLLRDDRPFSFNDSQTEVPDLSDDDREELMLALNDYAPDKPDLEEFNSDKEVSHNELSEDLLSDRDKDINISPSDDSIDLGDGDGDLDIGFDL